MKLDEGHVYILNEEDDRTGGVERVLNFFENLLVCVGASGTAGRYVDGDMNE